MVRDIRAGKAYVPGSTENQMVYHAIEIRKLLRGQNKYLRSISTCLAILTLMALLGVAAAGLVAVYAFVL